MLSYKQANVPVAEAGRSAGAAAERERDAARAGACRGARGLDRRRPGPRARRLGGRSWPSIRATCWRSAWRISSISGSAGRPTMLASVERVKPHWSARAAGLRHDARLPLLRRTRSAATTPPAEAAGRAAIELDPGDLWAAHGVAHVLEMQGRRGEGIAWIDELQRNWEGGEQPAASSLVARRDVPSGARRDRRVLELYDQRLPQPRRRR